ncbi:unnamed protein product [Mytilus edulis]|uniref:Uncharacterized protein n=1 Tax=Mytilus edulis TaxID=6550 RepID=A0A8S3U0H3_MYTED|nr:unnamed protein product [Mytilus edulis]
MDSIDDLVKKNFNKENYITCKNCQTLNDKLKRVCIGCGEREGIKEAKAIQKDKKKSSQPKKEMIQKIVFEHDKEKTDMKDTTEVHSEFAQFYHVTSTHQGKHEFFFTDPVVCNPNSSLSVARVLRKIGEENDILRYGGRKRHWTFICCDGLPYMIIRKLKQEAVICKNTLLENIKDRSLSVLGLSSSKSGTHSLGIDDAVLAFRVLLRKTNYLGKPTDQTSISGMALDEGLIGFTEAALGKRIHIIKTEFLGLPLQPEHYIFRHPVPVTPFEREKLYSTSNMTIKELQDEILKLMMSPPVPQFEMHYCRTFVVGTSWFQQQPAVMRFNQFLLGPPRSPPSMQSGVENGQ